MKTAIVEASKLLGEINHNEVNSSVIGRGNVFEQSLVGREVFTEVGVVTESELQDLVQRVSSVQIEKVKATGLTPTTVLKDHLGEPANSMYLISLRNLPCGEIHALRRMKVFSSGVVHMDNVLVDARRQIRECEAREMFIHHVSKFIQNMPTGFHDRSGFRNIATTEDIVAKLQKHERKVQEARQAAKEEENSDEEQESEQEDNGDESDASVQVANPHSHKAPASVSVRSTAKSKSKRKRAASPEPEMQDVETSENQDLDADLKKIATRLGSVPSCFYALFPETIMQSRKKCGRSLDAVPSPATIVRRAGDKKRCINMH